MKKLLFVCTGNTCRSSMAEALAKEMAASRGLTGWQFASAGIAALPGAGASEHAIRTMQEQGIDLAQHRARLLDAQLLQAADLVLTMTATHRDLIAAQANGKIYTLLEFAHGRPGNIEDPFGRGLDAYRQSARQISIALEQIIYRLSQKHE